INCGRAGAAATGATFEHETQKGYGAMKPNRPLADAFGRHLQELGWAVDLPPQRPRMGSTDMGDISQVIPSVHPYLAIGKGIVGHSVGFREAALSNQGFQSMLTAAKAMALTGLDVMTKPEFLEQVRADFSSGTQRQGFSAVIARPGVPKQSHTTGAGEAPLRSESARLPGVTLALAAPGPPV